MLLESFAVPGDIVVVAATLRRQDGIEALGIEVAEIDLVAFAFSVATASRMMPAWKLSSSGWQ